MATIGPDGTITPDAEELKKLLQGAGRASSGPDELTRRAIEAARARAATARSAAAAAAPGPMPQTAPSVPIGESVAPASTAAAASAPSFAARAARVATRALGPVAAGLTAYEAGRLLTPESLAVPAAEIASKTLGRIPGLRSLFGGYDDGTAAVRAAAALPEPAPIAKAVPAAPQPAPLPANPNIIPLPAELAAAASRRFIDGSEVPADGTGYIRNEQTGKVTALRSAVQPQQARRTVVVEREQPTPPQPVLGTEGGVFSNLAQFARDYGKYALSAAEQGRETKSARSERKLLGEEVTREALLRNAESNRIKAIADLIGETSKANKPDVKVLQDLTGTPILVDVKARTSQKIPAREKPTYEQFLEAAKKDPRNRGLTDEQLKTYYNSTYGNA